MLEIWVCCSDAGSEVLIQQSCIISTGLGLLNLALRSVNPLKPGAGGALTLKGMVGKGRRSQDG